MHFVRLNVTGKLVSYRFNRTSGWYYKLETAKLAFSGQSDGIALPFIELHFAPNANSFKKGCAYDEMPHCSEADVLAAFANDVRSTTIIPQLRVTSTVKWRGSKQRHFCEGACAALTIDSASLAPFESIGNCSDDVTIGVVSLRTILQKRCAPRIVLPFHDETEQRHSEGEWDDVVDSDDDEVNVVKKHELPWTIPALVAPKQKRPRCRR